MTFFARSRTKLVTAGRNILSSPLLLPITPAAVNLLQQTYMQIKKKQEQVYF